MADFQYEASNQNGIIVKGKLEASEKKEALKILESQGLKVIKVRKIKEVTWQEMLSKNYRKVTTKDVFLFTKYFTIVLKAGIPVIKGLSILKDQQQNLLFRRKIGRIISNVEGGVPLYEAFQKYQNMFPKMYCSLIKVGEESGLLYEMMERLTKYMEKTNELKGKVKGALMYPIVIMFVAFVIVAFLLSFVIPRFTKMFQSFGAELPLPTRIVVGASDFFKHNIIFIIIAIVGLFFLYRFISKTGPGRIILDRVKLKLPVFGNLILKTAINNYTNNLSILLRSGIPISKALEIANEALENTKIRSDMARVKTDIESGVSIADAFKKADVFPFMVAEMINVGDQTGTLESMLENISEFYEEEVDNLITNMTALIEPLFIVFLGLVVGTIVIAMFLPIFKISSAVMKGAK